MRRLRPNYPQPGAKPAPTLADADRLLAQLDERELAAGLDVLMRLLRSAAADGLPEATAAAQKRAARG